MRRWLALCACLLIDGATVSRVVAQQTARRDTRISRVRLGGYLGVGVEDIDEDRAKVLKLADARGVEIKEIEDGSPAQKAGLAKGDIVLEYNGQRIEGTNQFIRMVRETAGGHNVTLQILRNGTTQTVTAMVGARAAAQSLDPLTPAMPAMPLMPPLPALPALPAMPVMPAAPAAPMLMWRSGRVGIEAESLSGQLADYFGVKEGVLIRSVNRNSPADKGGLRAGDVVERVNGESVTTAGEILLQAHRGNSRRTIPFVVMRNHKEMTLQVPMASAPDSGSGEDL